MAIKMKKPSKQAAALLNDYEEKAVAYGRLAHLWSVTDDVTARDAARSEMLKARYRLEAYLTRCGRAAHGVVRQKHIAKKAALTRRQA